MKNNKGQVCIVAPLPRLAKRTRLKKFSDVYTAEGISVSFIGWEREDGERELPFDNSVDFAKITHRGGGYATGGLGPHYLKWVGKSSLILLKTRPKAVHALGLEGAVASLPLRFFFRQTTLIYDDADRFSLCHGFGERIVRAIQFVERLVARSSSIHLIPGVPRYPDGLPAPKTVELKNTPSRSILEDAMSTNPKPGQHPFQLLVTGWFGDTRGASVISAIVDELGDDDRFSFVVAGRLTGDFAQAFVKRPNVEYVGEVTNAEALRLAAESSMVFTLYDPSITINRYAEPNKWGDCVAVGTPFIVNEEVVTAEPYISHGAALSFPYDRPSAAVSELRALVDDGERYESMRRSIRGRTQEHFNDVVSTHLVPAISQGQS